jgi:hypothetical protein
MARPAIAPAELAARFGVACMAVSDNVPRILREAHDDLMACLAYARDALSSEKVFPSAA